MFDWRNFGMKENEGKEIGRKETTFPCLDERKNREKKLNNTNSE